MLLWSIILHCCYTFIIPEMRLASLYGSICFLPIFTHKTNLSTARLQRETCPFEHVAHKNRTKVVKVELCSNNVEYLKCC